MDEILEKESLFLYSNLSGGIQRDTLGILFIQKAVILQIMYYSSFTLQIFLIPELHRSLWMSVRRAGAQPSSGFYK